MTKSYKEQKNTLIVIIVGTLFLFISSVSLYIYQSEKKHLIHDNNERLIIEIELLGSYLSDLIARYDYAELKNYLDMVITKNNQITHLNVTLNNDNILFDHYEKNTSLSHTKNFTIGNRSFSVTCAHKTTALDNHLKELQISLIIFVIFFTTVSAFALWYILSRWILKPLNEEIIDKTKEIKEYSKYLSNIINSIGSHIAIIDDNGTIVRTNKAWQNFAKENGYTQNPSMVGTNYLQQCRLDDIKNCKNEWENGVIQVITGEKENYLGTYSCHSATEQRWFNLRANRFESNNKTYTILTHENITNVKLIQKQLEKLNRSFDALSEANMALIETKTENDLLDKVVEIIYLTSHYRLVWIGYKVDDKEQTVKVMAKSDKNSDYLENIKIKWSDCDIGKGPTGTAIREKRAVIVNDIEANEYFAPWREAALKRDFKSSAAFPIHYEDKVLGALNIYSNKTDPFIDEEIQLMQKLASNLAYGIIALRAKQQIELLSITDQLTGAFNRRKIDEVLSHEIKKFNRYKDDLCLMILDIDHFKLVNDTYGHQVGDSVLVEFTNILNETIRDTDILGRWGGEEFILILPNTNIENGTILAQRIRSSIQKYDFKTVGHKTVSTGLSLFLESDNENSIIERIDKALYEAKENGRNQVVVK